MTRRNILLIGSGLAAAAFVAACSSSTPAAAPTQAASSSAPTTAPTKAAAPTTAASTSASPTPAAKAATSSEAVTITLGYRSGNKDYFEDRAKAFAPDNPAIKIEQRPIAGSNDQYYPKLTSEMAAGSASDVFWVSTGFGLYDSYAWSKQLIDVSSYVKSENLDLTQWYKAAIETITLDGKLYALPWGMHPDEIGLYYNKELLEKANVEAPSVDNETYESLATKASKLTSKTGNHVDVWGIETMVGPYSTGLVSYVRSFGGDFMTDDRKKAAMDTPEALAALQWLYDVRTKAKCNPTLSELNPNNNGVEDSFVGGRIAMFNGGVWEMSLTSKIGKRFTMAMSLIPKGPKGIRGSMAHVDTISGYAKGKYPDQAFKLIEFCTNTESGVQNALFNSFWGARPDVWSDPRPKEKYGPMVDVWKSATENTMPLDEPDNFRLVELNTVMDNTLAPLWNGDTAPEQVVPKLQTAMNAVLAKPRQ